MVIDFDSRVKEVLEDVTYSCNEMNWVLPYKFFPAEIIDSFYDKLVFDLFFILCLANH